MGPGSGRPLQAKIYPVPLGASGGCEAGESLEWVSGGLRGGEGQPSESPSSEQHVVLRDGPCNPVQHLLSALCGPALCSVPRPLGSCRQATAGQVVAMEKAEGIWDGLGKALSWSFIYAFSQQMR